MSEISLIRTNRLQLVSISVECLEAIYTGDHTAAQAVSGFVVSPDCSLLGGIWVQRRLEMIKADPTQHPWMYRAIVRKRDNLMVGHISFHHKAPDPDLQAYSPNAAELGYTIEPMYRKQGYAKESAEAMMRWANQCGVNTFFLSISPDNVPSLRLAQSLGFEKIDEKMDEIDGLEYLLRRGGYNKL